MKPLIFFLLWCMTPLMPAWGSYYYAAASAGGGGGSITFDAASSGTAVINSTTITWSHTCTGSNRCLFVSVGYYDPGGATASGCTYNSVAMTEVFDLPDTTFTSCKVAGYVLAGPATGANNIVVTFSAAADVGSGGASSWTGVNQTTPNRTAVTADGYDDATPFTGGVTVTNAQNGDVVVDSIFTFTPTVTASLTSRSEDDNAGGDNKSRGHQSATATGSTAMTWDMGAESTWVAGGVALIPN